MSFTSHVALQHRLEQVAGGRREHDDEPEHDRLPDHEVVVAVLVERDERRRRRRRASRSRKPSQVLPGESVGASLCRPISRPPKYANVSAANTVEQHREREQPRGSSCMLAQQDQMREPEADPRGAEHRRRRRTPSSARASSRPRSARTRRRSTRGSRRASTATPPFSAPSSASTRADVDRRRERPQRPRHRHELVHGDHRGDGDEREEPPAAEPRPRRARRGRPTSATRMRETSSLICRRIYGGDSRSPRLRRETRPARSRARACR